jgi:hypothetical protein
VNLVDLTSGRNGAGVLSARARTITPDPFFVSLNGAVGAALGAHGGLHYGPPKWTVAIDVATDLTWADNMPNGGLLA